MSGPSFRSAAAIVVALIVPTVAGAQRARGAPLPPSASAPAPSGSSLRTPMIVAPQGTWGSVPRLPERRSPDRHVRRYPGRRFSGFDTFGAPIWVPYAVPVEVPYAVPVEVPYPVPLYPPNRRFRSKEPPRRPAPGESKMLVMGSGIDAGGGTLGVESMGDSLVRLTWMPNTRQVREARVFLADSAQRQLRSQRLDSVSTSALFETKPLGSRVRYAGLTVVMAHGTILTTLVPYPPDR
jgi:hypothetical protein